MHTLEGAVIACAGLGSRLGMGLPKCMIEIDGRTILSRLIECIEPFVPRIHVVVGYREELIIEHCARHHREVVLVRNSNYRQTNTSHSLMLGSSGFRHKLLYLDGDLIIDQKSIAAFIEASAEHELLVGVTSAKSSQAVFVQCEFENDVGRVAAFQRSPSTPWEWANLFIAPPHLLRGGDRYVYEYIEPRLPAPAREVQLFEVDTPEDLARATASFEPRFQ